jgi:hypothetical protein
VDSKQDFLVEKFKQTTRKEIQNQIKHKPNNKHKYKASSNKSIILVLNGPKNKLFQKNTKAPTQTLGAWER